MNANTRNELKAVLKTEGAKAVKEIAQSKGVKRVAHLGSKVVAQIVVKEACDLVETQTRTRIEELGLSIAVKGKLITVFDGEGEYVAHGHAWGDVSLKVEAWYTAKLEQVEIAAKTIVEEIVEPFISEVIQEQAEKEKQIQAYRKHQDKMLYLLNNWQPVHPSLWLSDDGDSNDSSPRKRVIAILKDGDTKVIGKFDGFIYVEATCGRCWNMRMGSEKDFEMAVSEMMRRAGLTQDDLAEREFDSVVYLGF